MYLIIYLLILSLLAREINGCSPKWLVWSQRHVACDVDPDGATWMNRINDRSYGSLSEEDWYLSYSSYHGKYMSMNGTIVIE